MSDEQRFPLTERQLDAVLNLQVAGAELQAVIQRGVTREEAKALDVLAARLTAGGTGKADEVTHEKR